MKLLFIGILIAGAGLIVGGITQYVATDDALVVLPGGAIELLRRRAES